MNRISEDEADNRHFVSQLEKGRNISYPDRRDLHVSFLVHNIHEVDVPRQRFHALFNVYVSWVEEKVNINPDADPSSDVWSKDMFEKCFDPELRITNCMEWNPDEDEIWYRVVTVDKTQKVKCNQYRHMSVSEFKSNIKDDDNVIILFLVVFLSTRTAIRGGTCRVRKQVFSVLTNTQDSCCV